ncbi:hypothetical protein BDN72DRAFT_906585 [Pluteus cervinus]|uniref:Uncharacterized protein n=1 Tax=Pluteus cervinus TaxID=181527 RepID=A0ACD2ZZV1_9AGAR|nr:hypothetical protein BDN72DRAFT_906585 [Pluteus cervinus]
MSERVGDVFFVEGEEGGMYIVIKIDVLHILVTSWTLSVVCYPYFLEPSDFALSFLVYLSRWRLNQHTLADSLSCRIYRLFNYVHVPLALLALVVQYLVTHSLFEPA